MDQTNPPSGSKPRPTTPWIYPAKLGPFLNLRHLSVRTHFSTKFADFLTADILCLAVSLPRSPLLKSHRCVARKETCSASLLHDQKLQYHFATSKLHCCEAVHSQTLRRVPVLAHIASFSHKSAPSMSHDGVQL